MTASEFPATVQAVITDPDFGRPTTEETPFSARTAVKKLGPEPVAVSTCTLDLNL
jgi:hypothetical protein